MNWDKDLLLNGNSSYTKKVMLNLLASMEVGEWNPYALAAKVYDDLNPSWEMAMNGPFRDGHIQAQKVEIETLQKMDAWDIVDRQPWMNVLPSWEQPA